MKTMTLILLALAACAHSPASGDRGRQLEEARALFERNIRAIQERNREGYLDCYLATDGLIKAGETGVSLGYAELAEGTAATGHDDWPESLEATDLEVYWVTDGVVYGAYRYIVVIDGERTEGWSERVFVRRDGRWWVAVTTAFSVPPGEATGEGAPAIGTAPECGPGQICATVTQGVAVDRPMPCECVAEPNCPPGLFPVFSASTNGVVATCADSMPPSVASP